MNELELVKNFYFTTKTKEARYSFLLNPDIPPDEKVILWISKDDKDAMLLADRFWVKGVESLKRAAKRIFNLQYRKDVEFPKEMFEGGEEAIFQSLIKTVLDSYQILELSLEIPNKDDFVLKVFGSFQGRLFPISYFEKEKKNYSKIIDGYTVDYVFDTRPKDTPYSFLMDIVRIETIFGDRGYFLTFAPQDFHKIEPEPIELPNPENPEETIKVTPSLCLEGVSVINSGDPETLDEHYRKANSILEEYLDRLQDKN